jgi:hypothetical protein
MYKQNNSNCTIGFRNKHMLFFNLFPMKNLQIWQKLYMHADLNLTLVRIISKFRCVVLLCIFRYWVPCCDVRYDFLITTMFGSSLLSVVCSRAHVLFTLLCLFANSGIQHIVFYFIFNFWGGCLFCFVLFLFFFLVFYGGVFVLCTLCCSFSRLSFFDCPFGMRIL